MKLENFKRVETIVKQISDLQSTLVSLNSNYLNIKIYENRGSYMVMSIDAWQDSEDDYEDLAKDFLKIIKEAIKEEIEEFKNELADL